MNVNKIFMNIRQLHFCKRLCNAAALVFFDRDVMLIFDFSDKFPDRASTLFFIILATLSHSLVFTARLLPDIAALVIVI